MTAYETLAIDFDAAPQTREAGDSAESAPTGNDPASRRFGLTEGRALRDEGMAQTEAADSDGWDKSVIDRAIFQLNATSIPWSANNLRVLLPQVRQPLIGARIRAARGRGEIRCVGYTPSDLPSTHAHDIKIWAASP